MKLAARFIKYSRSLLVGAVAGALLLPAQAFASDDPIRWRVQTHWPGASSSYQDSLVFFKNRIEERTDGRLVLELHEAGSLFPTNEIYNAVRRGILPMGTISPSYITERHSLAGIAAGMPFAFRELWEAVYFYRHLGFEDMLREQVARDGVYYHTEKIYSTEMVLRREVKDVDDFRRLRVRSAGTLQRFLTESGAAASNIPGGELYTALSQGVIDGAHWGAVQGASSMNLYEVAKYHVMPPLTITGVDAFIFSQRALDALPDDIRQIVMDTLEEQFWLRTIEYEYKEQTALARVMQNQGVQIHTLPDDVQARMTQAAEKIWEREEGRSDVNKEAMSRLRAFLTEMGYL